ncbi:MAG: MarR family winged helix-turn-helix transcriptional regulator [Bacteroidia bacterium]
MSREELRLWGDFGFSLLRVYSWLQRAERALAAQYQLGPSHVEALYLLYRLAPKEGWIPLRQLYEFFPLTSPAVGRLFRHLAYWRYVELHRDKADRRRILVRLLPAAYQVLHEIESLRARTLQHLFPPLSGGQLRQWVEQLKTVTFASACAGVEKSLEILPE